MVVEILQRVNRQSSVTQCSTNLLIRPLNANPLDSAEHLTSDGAKVGLRGTVAGKNMLHQELFHAIFDIRVPHDERGEANGHVESAIFLGGLGVRVQDVVDNGENRHESDFCSALDQLDEESRGRGERGIKVISIVCVAVSLDYKTPCMESGSPTCWRTRSTGSECQSSSLPGVKVIWGYTKDDTSVSK